MSARVAQLVASSVSVCCPYCGEPTPSPDNGSDMWIPRQIEEHQGRRQCSACDETFLVLPRMTAALEPA